MSGGRTKDGGYKYVCTRAELAGLVGGRTPTDLGPACRLVEVSVPTDGFVLFEDQLVMQVLKYDRRRKRAVLLVMEPLP